MTTHSSCGLFLLPLFALFFVSACTPLPAPTPDGVPVISATLRIDGDTVRVNDRPAVYDQPIRQGDAVSTGAGSSALIRFSDGTSVQLDQQTDPIYFNWSGDRLQLRMDDGAVKARKGGGFSIIEVIGRLADFFSWSHFVVEERRTHFFRADLFSGQMRLTRPTTGPVQAGGEYFLVQRGRTQVEYGRTLPSRAAEIQQRFDHWNFRRVEPTRVPNLIDLGLHEALQELERSGLSSGNIVGPTHGAVRVIAQSPEPGRLVDRGTPVDLTVRAVVRVPNLSRMSLQQARDTIEQQGLQLGRLSGAQSGERYVVRQHPAPETAVEQGSRVDLELGVREVPPISVPDVRKRLLRDAQVILERAGLRVGRISGAQIGDAVYVVDQSPQPGSPVQRGSFVNLTVRGVIR
jgi:beta-lactam-binding protein with PASTA domain